jgi:hypothetical protein
VTVVVTHYEQLENTGARQQAVYTRWANTGMTTGEQHDRRYYGELRSATDPITQLKQQAINEINTNILQYNCAKINYDDGRP